MKRFYAFLVVGIISLLLSFVPASYVLAFNPGDANHDGVLNMGDVTKVERIILAG